MKKLLLGVLLLLTIQICQAQLDQATINQLKVKLINIENLYKDGKYSDVLTKASEIEELAAGMESPSTQNFKVKALIGLKRYAEAKEELQVLYGMNPDGSILEDIASYESQIDKGIEDEIRRKEEAIRDKERKEEEARLAKMRAEEEAKRKEDEKIRKEAENLQARKDYFKLYVDGQSMKINGPKRIIYNGDKNLVSHVPFFYSHEHSLKSWIDNDQRGGLRVRLYSFNFIDENGEILYLNNKMVANQIENGNDGYEAVGAFVNGYAPVRMLGSGIGYYSNFIDLNGEFLLPGKEIEKITYFNEKGIAAIKKRYGKWSFINTKGEEVGPKYSKYYQDSSNRELSRASIDGKWGYINSSGEVIIPLEYDNAEAFLEGLAPIKKRKRWGYINTSGEVVIPIEYKKVYGFFNGIAAVVKRKQMEFINSSGDKVIPSKGELIEYFENKPFGYNSIGFEGPMNVELMTKEGLIYISRAGVILRE